MRVTISHVLTFGCRAWWFGIFVLLVTPCSALAQAPGPPVAPDPFADRGWHLELAWHSALETWNYNTSHESMHGLSAGLTYGLRSGLVLTARAPLYYVDQRGVDAMLFGVTAGVRGRVLRRGRVSVFLEADVGISESDTVTPPRGTRFNYLVLGGGGATVRLRHALHLLASMRWAHVSNGGLAGRDRNPDIEAVGPQVGVLIGF
jgi:hypothetical protein